MGLTTDQIMGADAGYWAETSKIKLQSGIFTFKNHEYQLEIMSSKHPRRCFMKGRQAGVTENEVLRTLHGQIYKRYPQGVLYLFPTDDVVQDFSKSRFNPLIESNGQAIGRYVRRTDTVGLKKIHDSFLFLRGAKLSQKIEAEDESSHVRGIPTDKVVFDEVDLMDENVIAKAKGTMGHSLVKEEVYISNPLLPNRGIHKIFLQSDQRHWWRFCESCNGYTTCAEHEFPDCVKIRNNGTGYIGCKKCGRELGIYPGKWIPDYPEKSEYMHGYRWSQLTSIFNDPAEIKNEYENPPQNNLGDVYRLRLGLPYVGAEEMLRESDVFACCGDNPQLYSSGGPCAMGLDVGKFKYHIVIGARTGVERYEIYKIAMLPSWNDVHDLCRRFNVKSGVIDIRPYEDSARQFQKTEPYKIWLCEYSETLITERTYNENTGIIKANRTEILDESHRVVKTPGQLTLPRISPEMKEFAKQLCSVAKVLEINKKTKEAVYRYTPAGEGVDHYRHALNYFLMAAHRKRIGIIKKTGFRKPRQPVADNEYARI